MTTARPGRRGAGTEIGAGGSDGVADHRPEYWRMADALRGSMDAAEYKHVVLGLIFLKYVSDAFEEGHAKLEAERDEGADPEDPDEYRGDDIFWVPPEARWPYLQRQARQPVIGRLVDDAMTAIERDNPALDGVLPKDYARAALDQTRLGQVVDLVSNIKVGGAEAEANGRAGRRLRVLPRAVRAGRGQEGRRVLHAALRGAAPGGDARALPRPRLRPPAAAPRGMFVQSVEFIRAHATGNGNGGPVAGDISIYGQESNYTTWRMARMNLAIRGIEGQIEHGDSFHNDRHPDLRADYILANPPFNVSDWGGERLRDDQRWVYGAPPVGNANFAWVQHFLHHLAPRAPSASSSPTARCPRTSRARVRYARTSSKRTSWIASSPYRGNSSARHRYPRACGSSPRAAAPASTGTAKARCCSSTPARWAA